VLGVVTGLRSEAKLLRGTGLACISTGGQAHIARARIDRLIARGVRGLVSFGIAGALSPELGTGDLIIADTVTSGTGEVWQTHEPWIDALLSSVTSMRGGHRLNDVPHHAASRRSEGHSSAVPLWSSEHDTPTDVTPALSRGRSGRQTQAAKWIPAEGRDDGGGDVVSGAILGRDRLLSSPQDKAAAFARTGALAIDMESHHVARAAAERGLPFIAVRAISDHANETLPAIMATFVDEFGQTRMSAVLAALILGRVKLGELLRTGRASKRAHQALLRCRRALAGLG
jgi:nucleoside phosphorylase